MLPAAAALGVVLIVHSAGAVAATRAAASTRTHLRAVSDGLQPRMFLLVSLPEERKVSYAELSNFQAVGNMIRPLIDAGLQNPRGIAYHDKDSAVFVADYDQQKIFRYSLSVQPCPEHGCPCDTTGATCGLKSQVSTTGSRLTVLENVLTQWVAVDPDGNLFYSDQSTNSVNRLSHDMIRQIENGLDPSEIKPVAESDEEALTAAASATGNTAGEPAAVAMYEAGESPHVGVPGGVVADATEVYWTNQADGAKKGTVGAGATMPQSPVLSNGSSAAPVFATYQMASDIDVAYGIAQTDGLIIFTGNSNYVYCVPKSGSAGGVATALSDGVLSPRGLVWDGDSTTFVADSGSDTVYSMPAGHCSTGVPLKQAVYVKGPFGLALIKADAEVLTVQTPASSSWHFFSGSGGLW